MSLSKLRFQRSGSVIYFTGTNIANKMAEQHMPLPKHIVINGVEVAHGDILPYAAFLSSRRDLGPCSLPFIQLSDHKHYHASLLNLKLNTFREVGAIRGDIVKKTATKTASWKNNKSPYHYSTWLRHHNIVQDLVALRNKKTRKLAFINGLIKINKSTIAGLVKKTNKLVSRLRSKGSSGLTTNVDN